MISLYEYNLPFAKTFKTGSDNFSERKGMIIHFTDDVEALAEAAPLPGFSKESFEDVRRFFDTHKPEISEFLSSRFSSGDITPFLARLPDVKSAQWAISMLALTVLSKREKKSFRDLLKIHSPQKSIRVNDVIGLGSNSEILEHSQQSITNGFDVLKFKVSDIPKEMVPVLDSIHHDHPLTRFRLDANRSWPIEKLVEYSGLFSHLPVEYIEEPVEFKNHTELKFIIENSRLPVALDESIDGMESLEYILQNYPDLFVIIKPALFGNFLVLAETLFAYRSTFKHNVITTLLESSIGRSMVAAAVLLIGDRSLAHGLNTGRFLAYDLIPDHSINKGEIQPGNIALQTLKLNDINKLFLKPLSKSV